MASPLSSSTVVSHRLFFLHPSPLNRKFLFVKPKLPFNRTNSGDFRMRLHSTSSKTGTKASLEDISYLLRIPQRKPYGTMESNVKKALKVAIDDKDKILASIPVDLKDKGSELYTTLIDGKGGLQALITSIKKQDPDKVSLGLAASLDTVADLELLQLLLPFTPRLLKLLFHGMLLLLIWWIQIVIDGYSAPLTAGNFAKLVTSGAYDGAKLNTVNQAVITEDGSGKVESVSVPLEVMPSGQFEPLYRTPLSVQDGELPVLPLSVYGAVAMAHSENSEEYSSPYQFFFYLYDKRNFHDQTEDILQRRLGVGRKFNHRRFIRRIGGVKALRNTSLLPSLAFRISLSSLGTTNPCRAHFVEPGRPEQVQATRTLRPDPWLLRLIRLVSDLPGISTPSPDGILLETCISN
ncbi:hypothetical protein [Arabidopsis thaliana]|nr:hypothetical protein [Arabidopsis thaliana]BAB02381.1 unnamed protein product [Arabidopsis thaliana]